MPFCALTLENDFRYRGLEIRPWFSAASYRLASMRAEPASGAVNSIQSVPQFVLSYRPGTTAAFAVGTSTASPSATRKSLCGMLVEPPRDKTALAFDPGIMLGLRCLLPRDSFRRLHGIQFGDPAFHLDIPFTATKATRPIRRIGSIELRAEESATLPAAEGEPITVPFASTVAPVAPAAATTPTFVAPVVMAAICEVVKPLELPEAATLQRSVDGLYVSPTEAQNAGTVDVGLVVAGAALQLG